MIWSHAVSLKHSSLSALAARAIAGAIGGRSSSDAAFNLSEVCDRLPLALIDRDGIVVEWTRGAETLYGWTREEAIGRNKRVLVRSREARTPSAWPPLGDRDMSLLTERRRDGTTLGVVETKIAVGTDYHLLSIAETDAGAVAAPARCRNEAAMLAVTPAVSAVGAFEIDVATRVISWRNDPWHMFGAPGGSRSVDEIMPSFDPPDAEQMDRDIRAAAARGDVALQWHTRIATMEPAQRAIDVAVQLFYDDGRLTRIIGIMSDLTEERRREMELSVGRAELQSILDTVPDGMIVADAAGVVRGMSATAAALLGYDRNLAAALTVQAILPEEWPVVTRRAADRQGFETTARRRDGARIPVEVRGGEATYGGSVAYALFVSDVSGRLAGEQRREALLNRQAQASTVSAIGEFAAQLSHEINQPFTALGNYLAAAQEMLRGGTAVDRPRLDTALSNARAEATRAVEILRRMQQLVAHRAVAMQPADLRRILDEAVALMPPVGWPGADIRQDIHPDAADAMVDPVQIEQVFTNLLRNAVQAPPRAPGERRTVVIEARPQNDMIAISVRDNGAGIDARIMACLFDPFTSTKGEQGMGLGLSICRTIVEAHGGTMMASNAVDGGAVVAFTVARSKRGR